MSVGTIQRVAVLDDNAEDREMTVFAAEVAGYDVVVVPPMDSIDHAVQFIRESADAVVTDHELLWGDYASFMGAELVSRCYYERIPGVLVTGYLSDIETSIRLHRRAVPELVSRNELDGQRLRDAIGRIRQELRDEPPLTRIPHAALVRIDRVNELSRQLDVVIPQWDPHTKVSIPADLLGKELLRDNLPDLVGRRFFASVNTGAEEASDLFFDNFEDAGEVPEDDDLE